jgi:hypothetical protein
MEESCQPDAPAASSPGKKSPRYPLDRKLGGPQSPSGHSVEGKNSQPPPEIEPRSSDRPAHSLVAIPTELSPLIGVSFGSPCNPKRMDTRITTSLWNCQQIRRNGDLYLDSITIYTSSIPPNFLFSEFKKKSFSIFVAQTTLVLTGTLSILPNTVSHRGK